MQKTNTRLDNVDLLRSISIVMVLVFHYTTRFEPSFYKASGYLLYFPWGHYGVDIFFSVSGFCILMTLSRSKSLSDFLAKRISRIQPAYMLAVVLTFLVTSFFGLPGRDVSLTHAIGNLIWLEAVPGWPMVDSVYWSLVVEIKFYVVIGVLYFLSKGKEISFRFSLLVLIASMLNLVPQTGVLGAISSALSSTLLLYPFSAMFLLGLVAWESRSGWRPKLVVATIIAFVSIGFSPRFADQFLLGIGIGIFVFVFLKLDSIRIPKAISYLGLISYSLYLFHQNIGIVIIRETSVWQIPLVFRIALASCVSGVLAIITYEFVEVRWRRQFSKFFHRVFSFFFDRIPAFVIRNEGLRSAEPVEVSL